MCRCHRRIALGIAVALLLPALLLPALAARVRVTADRVCLRAAALEAAEVVGQVSTGDELEALSSLSDAWVQVVPPPSVDLWVFAELVHEGAVIVSKAQVRAGAGLNFKVVGSLRRGTPIVERGRLGDWLKIAPPEGTSLWVSREFVAPMTETAAATPAPTPAPVPVAAAVSVPPEAPPPAAANPTPPPAPTETPAPSPDPRFPPTDPRYPEVPQPGAPATPTSSPATPSATPSPEPTALAADPTQPPQPTPAVDPTLVAQPTAPAAEPVVVLDPAALPAPAPATPAFTAAPVPDRNATAGWEDPGAGSTIGGAATAPAAPVTQTPPARPRVLLPQQPDAGKVVGPASIPKDRLSPHATQGKQGRYEGQLSRAGALFYTPSDHRLMVINRAGKAVTVCYVLGNESQLNSMSGGRLAIEGPVYWFKSTQYPTILAERIQRRP